MILLAAAAAWMFRTREQALQTAATSIRTVKAVRGSLAKTRRIAGSIFPRPVREHRGARAAVARRRPRLGPDLPGG